MVSPAPHPAPSSIRCFTLTWRSETGEPFRNPRNLRDTTLRRSTAGLRHTVEEINDPGFQRILGADHKQSIFLDQLLDQLRSVSQMACGGADVGPNRRPR